MYHESDLEQTVIEWLQDLGYDYTLGADISVGGMAAERDTYDEVVLKSRLHKSLCRINPDLSNAAIDEAMRLILIPQHSAMLQNNHVFHRFITHGIDVQIRQEDDSYRTEKVWIFDRNNIDNNDFLAVNQMTIIENNHTRRPDVILFINGLPLVVMELKNPVNENATLEAAYNQLETYKNNLPTLMTYNSFLVISDGLHAKAGSLTASLDRYTFWKTIDGTSYAPGNQPQLDVLIQGMLNKKTILDIIHNFVMFQTDGKNTWKILSAYQQYYAVNKAVNNAIRATDASGDRRIGVIWHTTGSGKSFTMAFFAGRLVKKMNNPTIIVITDRNDLDDQLYNTFCQSAELIGQTPEQAMTRADLRIKLMQRQSGGVIFTTIQKFAPDETDAELMLNERKNIIVIADEAHRSQYGFEAKVIETEEEAYLKYGLAHHMRNALPNASYIGFTGTPIEKKDKNTPAVFGDYIDIYDMSRAIDDAMTVPIYYESRLAKINFSEDLKPKVDYEFDEITEGREDDFREKKKSEWSRLEKVVGSQNRIDLVANDLIDHFENRQKAIWGKGMVVCMSRRICVDMYNAITRIRPDWHNEDDNKGRIKVVMTGSASDPEEFQPFVRGSGYKKLLAKRMKDPVDPLQIVLVCDMWLTGFDVPFLHTMYIDKPMNGHNLIQAISRVNRVYKDKPGGLIVDYIGFAHNLKEALQEYSPSDRAKTGIDPQIVFDKLVEILEKLDVILYGHNYTKFFSGSAKDRLSSIAETVDFIVKDEKEKREYKNLVLELGTAYALCKTLDEVKAYDEKVSFHKAVKAGIIKLEAIGKPGGRTLTDIDREINQLVSKSVISENVVDILAAAGIKKQDVSILSDEFLEEIKQLPYKNLALEALKRLLSGQIRSIGRKNLVQSRKFSELLQLTVNRYTARALDATQVIIEMVSLAKQVKAAINRGEELGLNEDEVAFYDALSTNQSAVELMGDKILRKIATEIAGTIRNNLTVDWTVRQNVQARMRLMIKKKLKEYKYPPDASKEAIKLIMEQAKQMCESESS